MTRRYDPTREERQRKLEGRIPIRAWEGDLTGARVYTSEEPDDPEHEPVDPRGYRWKL